MFSRFSSPQLKKRKTVRAMVEDLRWNLWRNLEHERIQQLNAEVTTRTNMQKERDRDKYKNEKKELKKNVKTTSLA